MAVLLNSEIQKHLLLLGISLTIGLGYMAYNKYFGKESVQAKIKLMTVTDLRKRSKIFNDKHYGKRKGFFE